LSWNAYNLAGTLDGLTLLDETVGTEKHDTDLAARVHGMSNVQAEELVEYVNPQSLGITQT
jgi:hypothetical protein